MIFWKIPPVLYPAMEMWMFPSKTFSFCPHFHSCIFHQQRNMIGIFQFLLICQSCPFIDGQLTKKWKRAGMENGNRRSQSLIQKHSLCFIDGITITILQGVHGSLFYFLCICHSQMCVLCLDTSTHVQLSMVTSAYRYTFGWWALALHDPPLDFVIG